MVCRFLESAQGTRTTAGRCPGIAVVRKRKEEARENSSSIIEFYKRSG
jgi:hypothetical protein